MIKIILAAIDGSKHASHAMSFAADLAVRHEAELLLFHAMPHASMGRIPSELREFAIIEHMEPSEREILRGVAEAILEQGALRAREAGVKHMRTLHDVGNPAELIVQYAKSERADLIVMGRRGLGTFGQLVLGSVSHKVMHLSECPCLTVP